jgi:putative tricarboxylic transport membrane protein
VAIGEISFLAIIIVICGLFLKDAAGYPTIAANLPRIFLYITVVLSVIRIYVILKRNKLAFPTLKKFAINKKIAVVMGGTLVFIILIQLIGFYISVALTVFGLSIVLGYKRYFINTLSTLATLSFIYLVFQVMLHFDFPKGLLGLL